MAQSVGRREAANYVSRILETKPTDVPGHLPAKFEFIINLRTGNALASRLHKEL
jgi:hypothetical protein